MKKRLFSILLAAIMVFSLLPVTAFATDFTNWTALTSAGGELSAGSYYLSGDVTLTSNLTISGDVTLDLNGYVLTGNGEGSVITVESTGNLTLKDSRPTTEHKFTVNPESHLWTLDKASGTETVLGGVITGGNDESAGGVFVSGVGTSFTMYGGSIVGNKAYRNGYETDGGGGVRVANSASFMMYGGGIIGNTSERQGGGVHITDEGSSFTMYGGVIDGNYANDDAGGVYAYEETIFTMFKGIISNNTTPYSGGGVDCYGEFTMENGSIVNNTSGWGGGGVMNCGNFTMNGGNITGNTDPSDSGGGVYNAYTCFFTMNGGKISDNISGDCGGGVYNDYSFTMTGGEITDNTADSKGGGVFNSSTFTMTGGEIADNTALEYGGGIQSEGPMNLTAAEGETITITGNEATIAEGGIANFDTLTISGKVIIKDNICEGTYTDDTYETTVNYPINLATDHAIDITGKLAGSVIYVTHMINGGDDHDAGVLTSGYTEKSGGTEVDDFFHYDGPSTYYMDLNKDDDYAGELEVINVPNDSKAVSIPSTFGGVITANKYVVADDAGDKTVTLTVTPDEGYALKAGSLKVYNGNTDVSVTVELTQDQQDETKYTFAMPAENVTVTAEFVHIHTGDDAPVTFDKAIKTFADLKELFANGGSGYLTKDIKATEALTIAENVDLCLNDKVLNLNKQGNITVSAEKTFNLYDCGETVRYYTRDDNDESDTYGLWTLAADQKTATDYTTTGGVITGGTGFPDEDYPQWVYGGGVYLAAVNDWENTTPAGTFTMYGGNIVGNTAREGGGVNVSYYGNFTMYDGSIVGNTANKQGGGVFADEDSSFIMRNGSISGNTADEGGGVLAEEDSSFIMHNGSISGNTTTDYGSGVCVCGSFTMYDGKIESNIAGGSGGGVCVDGGSFFMRGGSITGNKSKDPYGSQGGGVCNWNEMIMTGGSITGNVAYYVDDTDNMGGGIYNFGPLTLGGTAVVKNNYVEASDGTLYPCDIENDDYTMTIDGTTEPAQGMEVGLYGEYSVVTGASEGQKDYFFANEAGKYVKYNDDHTITLAKYSYTVKFNGAEVAAQTPLYYGDTVEKPNPDPTRSGYAFAGWYKDAAFTQAWDFENDTVRANMTLYAKWVQESAVGTVSGTVVNDKETPEAIPDADVKLMKGDVQYADTTSNESGNFSFTNVPAGEYQLVVEKDTATTTVLVTVANSDVNIDKITLYMESKTNSAVEITGSDTPDVMVGGLEAVASANKDTSDSPQNVTVTLEVESKTAGDVDREVKGKIETAAGNGKELDFIDMTLLKKVGTDEPTPIADTEGNLLEVVIPYNMSAKNNVGLYRQHGTDEHAFKLPEGEANKTTDGEYVIIDKTSNMIRAHLRYFSTYAIGYEEESSGGNTGGGGSSYAVETSSDIKNGKVEVSPKNASAGQTVTITVTPDKGFTLETLTVLDKNGKEVELKSLGNNKYSFKMPSGKVTVSATFMEDNTMLNFFVDVKATDYFYDAVLWAAENDITKGTDAVHFSPDMGTTRAQVVTFLWRAAGSPEAEHTAAVFKDVSPDAYYVKAVEWALSEGITKGTSDTTFSPDMVCTRGQIVTFLARFAGVADEATGYTHGFTDVNAADYFNNAVAWAKDNNVTEGTSTTTFSPNDDCTRAQVVTFLYRWMVK